MRANVKRFLPYWQQHLVAKGAEYTASILKSGKTIIMLTRKDRFELLKELGLR